MTNAQVFALPDLGEGLTEAHIIRWLVAVGDDIGIDQSLLEVETAKSIVELPSPYAGRVTVLHGAEGDTLAVGTPLITIASATRPAEGSFAKMHRQQEKASSGNVLIGYGTTEHGARGRRRRPRDRRPGPHPASVHAAAPTAAPAPADGRNRPLVSSPLVRRLARDGGIDLADVASTGEDGVITRSDVVHALAAREPSTPARTGERRRPLSGFRKAVAASMSRSRAEIPEATVWVDVDATALWQLRERTRTPDDPGPRLLTYIARFVIAGLKRYPVLNARLDAQRQEIVEFDHVHLGLAVQSNRGLVVPAVMNTESMTTERLDAAIRDVTSRAREGRATADELAAGTFTLNNYGSFRVDGSAAIINHPQVAILGLGRIIDRPWAIDGQLCVRKMTQMSFVFDHRVCDGNTAAGFIRVVADAIEDPTAAIRNL